LMAVALITGGSRGIGAATAVRLAQDGHDVAIAYRSNAQAAEQVAAEVQALGPRAATFAGDMSEVEAPGALVSAVERELGPVEILIAAIVRNPYLTNQSILVDGGIRPS
jgi:3-oxoacyl-[acyl-carrier protein] reductase